MITGRLATSVAVSAFQQALEPGNRYLSISEAQAWDALERLSCIHPRHAIYAFREACGLAPVSSQCPRREVVAGESGQVCSGNRARPDSARRRPD